MSDAANPVLSGFGFPFRIERGGVARAEGSDKVEQDVRHLLSTRLGERLMRRGYGGGVHRRVQDPNVTTLRALVKREIEDALRLHMPAVRLIAPIRVASAEEELRITIEYAVNPLDVARSLELRIP
ncbi:GPW/gp25 family protein [Sorangium sp. So ce429]